MSPWSIGRLRTGIPPRPCARCIDGLVHDRGNDRVTSPWRRTYSQSGGWLVNDGARFVAICEICCLAIVVVATTARDIVAGPLAARELERVAGRVVQPVRAARATA